MKSLINHSFIELTSLLRFDINYAHVVEFKEPFKGANTIPYNRLFVVSHDSPENDSWFANRSAVPQQKVDLLPGNAYFLPADLDYQFNFEVGLNIRGYHFSLEIFPGLDIFSSELMCQESSDFPDLIRFVSDQSAETLDIGKMGAVRGALLVLVSSFCQRTTDDIRHLLAVVEEFQPLVEFFEQEGNAQTDITRLAEKMGMNRDQLRKRFVRRTGIPLKTYMNKSLTRKASELLLLSDTCIYEVAHALAFSSEYYFSRFFKKQTGSSPSQYRKSVLLSR